MYFRNNSTRAHGLGVEFTDVEHIQIELWAGRTHEAFGSDRFGASRVHLRLNMRRREQSCIPR